MNKTSRRALARYAAEQLLAGKSPASLAKQLAAILAESGRRGDSGFLLSDIAWELEHRQVLTIAQVTTATPLSKALEAALKIQLKKATKANQVLIEKHVDKSLLGGIKIEASDSVWDMSVSHELTQLREIF